MKTLILAPQYREEERKNAQLLCDYLREEGAFCSFMDSEIIRAALIEESTYQLSYSVGSDGSEGRGRAQGGDKGKDSATSSKATETTGRNSSIKLTDEDMALLAEASLALDIYLMVKEADCCIGLLNGKDEAVLLKLGIAYALGIPVYLYKNDPRVVFIAGENSMILGLSRYKPFKDVKKLRRRIMRDIDIRNNRYDDENHNKGGNAFLQRRELSKTICENLADQIEMGRVVCESYYRKADKNLYTLLAFLRERNKENNNLKMEADVDINTDMDIQRSYNEKSDTPCVLDGFSLFKDKAYCSGPLFSPDEQREMAKIAAVLEKNGIDTYLPQRDGGEPYFFDSMGSPLSGMLLAKPFSNLVHRLIFDIDIKEIIECKYFVLNLNGRYYDEGAMAEAGIAYALGKVIILFHSDQRDFFRRGLLPLITAITPLKRAVNETGILAEALEEADIYSPRQTSKQLTQQLASSYRTGKRALHLLSHIKKPANRMLSWPK